MLHTATVSESTAVSEMAMIGHCRRCRLQQRGGCCHSAGTDSPADAVVMVLWISRCKHLNSKQGQVCRVLRQVTCKWSTSSAPAGLRLTGAARGLAAAAAFAGAAFAAAFGAAAAFATAGLAAALACYACHEPPFNRRASWDIAVLALMCRWLDAKACYVHTAVAHPSASSASHLELGG